MVTCACGSGKAFEGCCRPFLDHQIVPGTPEALMRSRYTAYTLGNTDWIGETMRGKPAMDYDAKAAGAWALSVIWTGLAVRRAWQEDADRGFVEFEARFISDGYLETLHETSEFHRDSGHWYYVDGVQPVPGPQRLKLSRNAPCPCGSGKKCKQCHGRV